MTGGSDGGETPTQAAGGPGDPDEAAEQGSTRGTATCSEDTKRRHGKAISERINCFSDSVCGDILARAASRLGAGTIEAMLLRKGMPQFWETQRQNSKAAAAKKAAAEAAVRAEVELDGPGHAAEELDRDPEPAAPTEQANVPLERGEQELAMRRRTTYSNAISKQLA
eukprot:5913035-Pleurochrysis_carterae.AAC.1